MSTERNNQQSEIGHGAAQDSCKGLLRDYSGIADTELDAHIEKIVSSSTFKPLHIQANSAAATTSLASGMPPTVTPQLCNDTNLA